ncbi:DUF2071 domain-containing protein [Paenibacillus sp. T3-5-0-4]|nr:DUF2071 domain-containing protein [Paenibacillus endoradicis]
MYKQDNIGSLIDIQRPYPISKRPWVMHQIWNDVLFAHWPIPIEKLQEIVPSCLPLDSYDGQAWISVVPCLMSGVRPRFIPAVPYLSQFPQINVRTYVTLNGKPGVYFFSLDADQSIVVELARIGFKLPYLRASIEYNSDENHNVSYYSTRRDSRANSEQFQASYRPIDEVTISEPESLEYWLTERYCLYSVDTTGRVYRGEIDHCRWPLQRAEAEIEINSLLSSYGIELSQRKPHLHFAKKLHVHAWLLESCQTDGNRTMDSRNKMI